MRYLILITAFLLIPNIFFAQQTYVPDDNFEQALINLGYDEGEWNDSVPTAKIDTVIVLDVGFKNISNLTGIEDFKSLQFLICYGNNLLSLDVRNNTTLEILYCWGNNLTSLYVSNNPALKLLDCKANDLTSLDVSNNPALQFLWLSENNLLSLDVSNNPALEFLNCGANDLTSLDIKNGNNKNITGIRDYDYFNASDNPDLYCIQVDDSAWSANAEKWAKDDKAQYSEDCTKVGVEELSAVEPEISIFPNPAGKNFTVSFELETPKTIHLALTDLSGIELQEFTLEHKQYVNEEIDVSMLSSGVYFLRIEFGSESISRKIVVE